MAPLFGDAEIPLLLADLGEDVILGATTVKGLVDEHDLVASNSFGPAEPIGRELLVTIESKAWTNSGLGTGGTVTVRGAARKVAAVILLDDGAYTQVRCARVT